MASLLKRMKQGSRPALSWRGRVIVLTVTVLGVIVVLATNQLLSTRYTINTQNRAEVRQALYAGNLISELQRNSVVPLLLAREPGLISSLATSDFSPIHAGIAVLRGGNWGGQSDAAG